MILHALTILTAAIIDGARVRRERLANAAGRLFDDHVAPALWWASLRLTDSRGDVTCRACKLAIVGAPLPAMHYAPAGVPVCGAAPPWATTDLPARVRGCDECEARAMTGAEVGA